MFHNSFGVLAIQTRVMDGSGKALPENRYTLSADTTSRAVARDRPAQRSH